MVSRRSCIIALAVIIWILFPFVASGQGPILDDVITLRSHGDDWPYMIGTSVASLIFVESNGKIDRSVEDWTDTEKAKVVEELSAAIAWWANHEPKANMSIILDVRQVFSAYEPTSRGLADQHLWMNDVMSRLGYDTGFFADRVYQFNQSLENRYDVPFAFTLFMVDGHALQSGHYAYACLGGPFMVLTSGNGHWGIERLEIVAAHELGHTFGALDQYYASRVPCGHHSGFLQVENQNSEYGKCLLSEPSIMKNPAVSYFYGHVDHYARGQIGWRDSDGDGLFDPVDPSPQVSEFSLFLPNVCLNR